MKRKDFITTTALGLATSSLFSSLSAQDHKQHNMTTSSNTKYGKAMMSAIHCKLAAEVCLSHCLEEMSTGDKSMGACAKSTREVISACDSFLSFASANSSYTKKLASLCKEICENCANECKKHADHHKDCKDCMDSCLSCAKEMAKV